MKRLLYGAPFLIFWIIVNYATTWAQQAIGPRMDIEKKFFDAKQVKEGEIIKHTFTVLNTGDRLLEIKKVRPG
jgi:adenine specific DNA methylase Mod